MDFALSDSLQELLARASAFMEEHVYPLEPIVGEKGFFGATDELEAARKACKEAGLWAPQMPKEYGGAVSQVSPLF